MLTEIGEFVLQPSLFDEGEVTRRAFAAWFRTGGTEQPGQHPESGIWWLDDRAYVVLRNVKGVLAVYRIRKDGALRRMRRWPKEIE